MDPSDRYIDKVRSIPRGRAVHHGSIRFNKRAVLRAAVIIPHDEIALPFLLLWLSVPVSVSVCQRFSLIWLAGIW